MGLLFVEDDTMIGNSLKEALNKNGYVVDWTTSGEDAIYLAEINDYELILLDLGLPKICGVEVIKLLRNKEIMTPILILTARDSTIDIVTGLDSGADDYLVKPFKTEELLARIRAILRRKHNKIGALYEYQGLILDPLRCEVTIDDITIQLTSKESTLLRMFILSPGVPFSKIQLEEKLYSYQESLQSNTIEVFIHTLRKKIGNEWIKNIRGLGYYIPLNVQKND
ncbi:MAG: response regulator transcription factor [Thiovulaceae bacterium]|nr:response regulator transcription factor [Sulfurimonadaceae bacterium]